MFYSIRSGEKIKNKGLYTLKTGFLLTVNYPVMKYLGVFPQ